MVLLAGNLILVSINVLCFLCLMTKRNWALLTLSESYYCATSSVGVCTCGNGRPKIPKGFCFRCFSQHLYSVWLSRGMCICIFLGEVAVIFHTSRKLRCQKVKICWTDGELISK